MVFSIQMVTPCGMDRGVVPLAPAVPSTHHHGSTLHCLPPTTDYIEVRICAEAEGIRDEDSPIQLIELYVK